MHVLLWFDTEDYIDPAADDAAPVAEPDASPADRAIEAARRSIPSWQAILEPNPDGVVMRLEAENLDWLARLLAGLGCPFVVREPPELREAVRRLGETLLGSAQRGPA